MPRIFKLSHHCLLWKNGSGPFGYFSIDGWHNMRKGCQREQGEAQQEEGPSFLVPLYPHSPCIVHVNSPAPGACCTRWPAAPTSLPIPFSLQWLTSPSQALPLAGSVTHHPVGWISSKPHQMWVNSQHSSQVRAELSLGLGSGCTVQLILV